jgi:hypothetical protein
MQLQRYRSANRVNRANKVLENDGSGTDRLRSQDSRLTRKAVEDALSALRDRIATRP